MGDTDYIVLSSDVNYYATLNALANLQRNDRLRVTAYQVVSIDNIESSSDDEPFVFGGEQQHLCLQAFSRTASSVIRLCMMKSADMQYIPNFQSKRRNMQKMQYSFDRRHPDFSLGHGNRAATMRYYSRFDQLHPHFLLEQQFRAAGARPIPWWTMRPTMMLIFQNNFSKVIEFSTTLSAREKPELGKGTIKSYVNVRCIVRNIDLDSDASKLFDSISKFDDSIAKVHKKFLISVPSEEVISDPPSDSDLEPPKPSVPTAGTDSIIDLMAQLSI